MWSFYCILCLGWIWFFHGFANRHGSLGPASSQKCRNKLFFTRNSKRHPTSMEILHYQTRTFGLPASHCTKHHLPDYCQTSVPVSSAAEDYPPYRGARFLSLQPWYSRKGRCHWNRPRRSKLVATRIITNSTQPEYNILVTSANSDGSEIGLLRQPSLVVRPTIFIYFQLLWESASRGKSKRAKDEPEAIFPAKLVSNFRKINHQVLS